MIPPGVNLDLWKKPEDCHNDPGTIKILFVGGNLERKGGKELLEAFSHLLDNRSMSKPKLELHLVTKDAVPERLNVIPHYGLKPNSPELKDLFFTSDIFCLPTHGDCLPMALAEAGAVGLPIVSTRVAGIPELVIEGENGYLTQPNDIKGLMDVLERLVEDASLRTCMGMQSMRIVSEGHNLQHNAQLLTEVLRNVIDQSRQ